LRLNSKTLVDSLPSIFKYYDQPIADNSILPTFLLSKLVKKHVTVALDGDGGDENFAGYDRYQYLLATKYLNNKFANEILNKSSKIVKRIKPSIFTSRLVSFTESLNKTFNNKYQHYNSFFGSEKQNLITNSISADTFDLYSHIGNNAGDLLDKALYTDIKTYLPDNLLYKVDISSMAFGLELRAPFLDHEFMEMAAKIPSIFKIKNGQKKYILAKALVESGTLPAEIVYRKKRGFNIPIKRWLKHELKDYVVETILGSKLVKAGYFNEKLLSEYVECYYTTDIGYSNNIFALLSLCEWANEYL
jgi:asparagine synthase (glutamine-hydrolysing)